MARCIATTASRPCRRAVTGRLPANNAEHQPPLRPDAPKPIVSRSHTTIRKVGSARCNATSRRNSASGSGLSSTRKLNTSSSQRLPDDFAFTTISAADCLPRMSPPTDCAASSAASRRSARSPFDSAYAFAIAGHTLSFDIKFACAEKSFPIVSDPQLSDETTPPPATPPAA